MQTVLEPGEARPLEKSAGRLPWLRTAVTLVRTEALLYARLPVVVFFGVAFPVLLLLLFGSFFGELPRSNGADLYNLRVIDFYLPALIAMAVGQAGLVSLPGFLSGYREAGILKRYHVSPIPLELYLLAHLVVQGGAIAFTAAVMALVAEVVFGVTVLGPPAVLLLIGLGGGAAFFAAGFALSGLVRAPQTAQAVGNFLFLTMFFLSGAAIPLELFPEWLRRVSMALPLTHFVQAFAGVWLGEPVRDHAISLVVLAATTLVAVVIARRTFSAEQG